MNYEDLTTDQLLEALPQHLHAARNDNAEPHDRWRIYNMASGKYIEPGTASIRDLLVSTLRRTEETSYPEEQDTSESLTGIESLIKELRGLQVECENRASNLLNDEPTREKARAAASAYGYCIIRLRDL